MRPALDLSRCDSAADYTLQDLHPMDREPPATRMGDSLLPADMERSDAPAPAPAPAPAIPTPARPVVPAPRRAPRPVRVVKPVNESLSGGLAVGTAVATFVTSFVLALVYGRKLGDQHGPLPACVISAGSGGFWNSEPAVFNPAVPDCREQYNRYSNDVYSAGNKGFGLGVGVFVGGILAAGVFGVMVGSATHATQQWAHRRQLRLAAAEAAEAAASTAPGIEMV